MYCEAVLGGGALLYYLHAYKHIMQILNTNCGITLLPNLSLDLIDIAFLFINHFCIVERTNILWNQNPARTSLVEESNVNVSGLFVFKVNGLGGLEFPTTSELVPPTIICKFYMYTFIESYMYQSYMRTIIIINV